MAHDYGKLLEDEFAIALENKKYEELSPNLKTFIRDIFGAVNRDDFIHCQRLAMKIKPDIMVSIGETKKYVSLKSGGATILHCENIKTIVLFLRALGLSTKSQKTLLLWHYGDGTMDGSGKDEDRRDYHETIEWIGREMWDLNHELIASKELVIQMIDRAIFLGVNKEAEKAEFIYHGDIENGYTVSRSQVLRYLDDKTWGYYTNLHFGPLLIRPQAKYAHKKVKNQEERQRVMFYWPGLGDEIRHIYKRYNNTYRG